MQVKRMKLCDQLIAAMIELIKSGEWPQGSKLHGEIELANSFNVSRNIIREALKILENFGILDAKNGVGTFVSDHAIENFQNMQFFYALKDNKSVEALLELRLMIEPSAAYFAAIRINDDGIKELKDLSKRLIQKYDTDPSYQDDFDLHAAVAHYSGNDLCESLITSLLKQLQNSLYAEFNKYASEKTKKDNQYTHIAIIKAITEHNPQTARQLMEGHICRRIMLINPEFESGRHISTEFNTIFNS